MSSCSIPKFVCPRMMMLIPCPVLPSGQLSGSPSSGLDSRSSCPVSCSVVALCHSIMCRCSATYQQNPALFFAGAALSAEGILFSHEMPFALSYWFTHRVRSSVIPVVCLTPYLAAKVTGQDENLLQLRDILGICGCCAEPTINHLKVLKHYVQLILLVSGNSYAYISSS